MAVPGPQDPGDILGRLLALADWASSPLGDPARWPQALITMAGLVLDAHQPMLLAWGDDLVAIYNAEHGALIGDHGLRSIGRPLFEAWHDVDGSVEPRFRRALRGEGSHVADVTVSVVRPGGRRLDHVEASYTPVRDSGKVVGVLCLWTASAGQVLGARQGFRLELERCLRDLTVPRDVMQAAAEMLGQHVRANWAGYAEVEADGEHFTIERDWSDGGVASIVGRYRLSVFGAPLVGALQGGGTVALDDAHHDARTNEAGVAAAFAALGVRSSVGVPLVKSGRLAAVMFVACVGPRAWAEADVALAEEVAERTWAQVERARAEAAVRENARELRLVADAMPGLIGFIDASLTYRFANRTYEVWFGVPPEQVVGRTVLEVVGEAGEALRRPFMARALAGEPVLFEATWPYADGRTRTVDIRYQPRLGKDGDIDGFYAFVIDVTERKEVEERLRDLNAHLERIVAERTEQLRAEEARLRTIFETSYQLQLLLALDGTLLAANAAALAAVGATASEVVGLVFWRSPWFAATAGLPDMMRGWVGAAAAGETVRLELELDLPGGRRSFDFALRPVRQPDGTQSGILAEAADTTEHRLAEEQLRQSQRMEAVGQLTGGVAHDFNNLLTVMRSSADLLRRPGIAEDRRRRYADAIVETVDRAAKLTGQLLAFARRQALRPEVFDAGAALAGLGDMLATLSGPRIRLEFRQPQEPCLVFADPSQFDTAIVNLVANARDAMPDGGLIEIAVSESAAIPTADRPSPGSGSVAVSVADDGTGMPPDQIGRIFEPFFTTKEPGKGTGLGLAMVYGFVKQSGGDVSVGSAVGQGTTVTLQLPRATGPLRRDPASGPQLHVDGHGARVLVVEDNADVGLATSSMLNEIGYRSMLARNADEALALLARDPSGVDVVFSDVVMPGMDGVRLAEEIGRRHAGLPVILTSGYSDVLAQGGARHFELLQKPYSLERLSTMLGDAVRRAVPAP